MHANDKAIYGCTYAPAEYKEPEGARLTYNPKTKRLYVHVFNYPADGKLILPGYAGKVRYVQLLNDDSEIKSADAGDDLSLTLPVKKPPYDIPVIELILR
jgi:alpha-L-fucosidase